ncbi:phage scaffolding protein [Ligilactobacillus acidipiscis]|uniref:phage scaffolding protein n=1 Tax=Ligilactobacillus acidipiscis TaxID=89059 RepID=UPI0023FA1195|nr:phage scaffolding protein [Ligilactobacillus acidipiscis]WEV56137.1 phage scaffolding protein [Ligilactobacillus acidipiscis]
MEKQELLDLGIDEDVAKQVLKLHGKDIQAANSKTAAAESERDGLQEQLNDRDSQLKDIKKSAGDNEELQKQIKSLQEANDQSVKDYQAKLASQQKDFKIENALTSAGARNTKAVRALLDTDSISVKDDGSLDGFSKQLEALQKDDDYLFEKKSDPKPTSAVKISASGNPSGGGQEPSLVDKIAARMSGKE